MKNALADCGIELESLSEPDFDSEKYTIESVTMYPNVHIILSQIMKTTMEYLFAFNLTGLMIILKCAAILTDCIIIQRTLQ